MYKLKNSYIDQMVSHKLSSREIDFILYISLYQDNSGRIESVYYRDVCDELGISVQKFYDIINHLSEKNLIRCDKIHRSDICVTLIGNDFSDQKFSEGYLKVAATDFRDKKFRKLKAGAKLLYLYMQRFIKGKHMLVQNFYEDFCRIFQISKKSLQIYLHELKANSLLFVSKKRNKSLHYEMTIKNSTVLQRNGVLVPHEKELYIKNIMQLIKRNLARYLPDQEEQEGIVQDIAKLADTKRAERYKDFVSRIVSAAKESIRRQKDEGKERPILNAALVNSCLTRALEQEYEERYGVGTI